MASDQKEELIQAEKGKKVFELKLSDKGKECEALRGELALLQVAYASPAPFM